MVYETRSSRRIPADGNFRRLRSNLRRSSVAQVALGRLGIEAATVETYGMGLREPYARADGRVVDGVLSYALSSDGGRWRFGSVNLDGVTSNGEHRLAWSPGRPMTLKWSVGIGTTLVCGSPIELWQLGQAVERANLAITLVASSRPDEVPAEWADARFWAAADRVVLTDGVGPAMRRIVTERVGARVEHALGVGCPAEGGEQTAERHDAWLQALLLQTVRCVPDSAASIDAAGDFAADAVAVRGGFYRGHLLYPFEVERRREEPGELGGPPRLVYSFETLVLRGDGAVLEVGVLPAPRGTPPSRRVHSLSDGTRIQAPPGASGRGSWSLPSIRAFIAARSEGVDPCARPSRDVFADVHEHLASHVVLPDPAHLHVAAAFVVMSHMFRVFHALPILRIVGPRASGKTELATAIASLAYGGCVMGQGSAAALVRLASECGGLVVLDDAERLATDGGGFGELAQCLKAGYKSASAKKPVVLGGGRVEVFDFFGPRVITATRDVDPILASRCVDIRTEPSLRNSKTATGPDASSLRDELHTLAMARADEVAHVYKGIVAELGDRDDEIWAPLLAVSTLLGGRAHEGRF